MANEKKLRISFEAENKELRRVISDNEKRIKGFERQALKSSKNVSGSFNAASAGARNFGRAANDARAGVSGVGRSAGQLGIQFSQLTGQIQGGQNAMLAISQQAQDIGFILGPAGALGGAVVSIVAALSMSFLPALFDSTDALKKMEVAFTSVDKIIKETKGNLIIVTDEFSKLTQEANKLSRAKIKIALGEISDALEAAKEETIDLAGALSPSELGGRFARTSLLFKTLTGRLEEGRIELDQYARQVSKLFVGDPESSKEFRNTLKEVLELTEKSNQLMEAQSQLEGGLGGAVSESRAEELEKQAQALEKLGEKSNQLANSSLFKLEDQVFSIQDSMRTQTEIINDSFNERIALLKAYKKRYIDEVAATNEIEKQLEIQKNQALQQVMLSSAQGVLSSFGQMTSQIQQMTEEGSKAQKAFFLVNQAIAAAGAIIKGFQAAMATRVAFAEMAALTANPALIPAGEAMAQTQTAMGFASAGMIAGQTLASFEGGGFTPSGPRSGGMDNKGGMLAMVHPNEKITDLTKEDGSSGITIINNSPHVSARPEITPEGVRRIIIDEVGNQNSRSRSILHKTSNVVPRGTR